MSKETDLSVLEQANAYVQKTEQKEFVNLFVEYEKAEHRADACGCFQCRKYAESTKYRLEMEMRRLDPHRYHPDHEEEYITAFAIRKVTKKHKK